MTQDEFRAWWAGRKPTEPIPDEAREAWSQYIRAEFGGTPAAVSITHIPPEKYDSFIATYTLLFG